MTPVDRGSALMPAGRSITVRLGLAFAALVLLVAASPPGQQPRAPLTDAQVRVAVDTATRNEAARQKRWDARLKKTMGAICTGC